MQFTKIASICMAVVGMSACVQPDADAPLEPMAKINLTAELSQHYKSMAQNRPEDFEREFYRSYSRMGMHGDVTDQRIRKMLQSKLAQARARVISKVLNADLDGDGRVSTVELLNFSTSGGNLLISEAPETLILDFDVNGDGIVSLKELVFYSRNSAEVRRTLEQKPESYFMLFDADDDGIVKQVELIAGVEKIMHNIMAESEPVLIGGKTARQYPRNFRKLQKPAPVCDIEIPKANHKLVFLSGGKGDELSKVAVTNQSETTYVARIVIEPGKEKLYILATTYSPTLWTIEGDVSRVAKFVTQRNLSNSGVGVTGLAKEHIVFLQESCIKPFSNVKNGDAILAVAHWAKLTKRPPDFVYAHTSINTIALPSGKFLKRSTSTLETDIVDINIADVVAPGPVESYDVLPQRAGIKQLLKEGSLEKLPDGKYLIKKPIDRFPAGLNGAYQVSFILGKGVPMPKGSPGHSLVYSAETGECLLPKNKCKRFR